MGGVERERPVGARGGDSVANGRDAFVPDELGSQRAEFAQPAGQVAVLAPERFDTLTRDPNGPLRTRVQVFRVKGRILGPRQPREEPGPAEEVHDAEYDRDQREQSQRGPAVLLHVAPWLTRRGLELAQDQP